MKIKIFLIILVNAFIVNSFSQGCPNSTDILATNVCGLYGDANGNSNWNWELNNPNNPNYCNNWYGKVPLSSFLVRMGSPFVNATSGRLKIIADAQDYTKAKGWELLQRKFGCYNDVANPYFILYNKYTGVIRVYVYVTAGSGVYSQIMMRVRSVTRNRPATLSQANDIMETPEQYLSGTDVLSNDEEVLISVTDAAGNASWTVGEFVTTLDNNISDFSYSNASLEVSVYGVTNSTLKASLKGISASGPNPEDLKDGMFIKKNAPSAGNQFNFTVQGEKLIKFGKKVDDLIVSINKTSVGLATALSPPGGYGFKRKMYDAATFAAYVSSNNFNFKKEINKFTKYLGKAGEILQIAGKISGFFEDAPATAGAAPTFTNYNLELNGTIQSQVVVTNFVLKVPATLATPNNSNNSTYYNCNLGTFNLKKRPVVEFLDYDRRALMPSNLSRKNVQKTIRYTSYRIKNDVEMVVNTGAGLELVTAEGALVAYTQKSLNEIKGSSPITLNPLERHPNRGNYTYFNHMYADILANRLIVANYDIKDEAYHTIQTPYYDMRCIKNAVINITDPTLKLFFRVRATLRKIGDPNGELFYYINDYNISKVAGNPADIPSDLVYDLSAFPPYRNYTIPPNVQSTPVNYDSYLQNAAPDDYVVEQFPYINQANARYNHSIITSPNYYTTIASQTNGVVTFRAGAYIELNPKFEAQYGASFLATIDFGYFNLPCSPSMNLTNYTNPNNCYVTNINAQRVVTNVIKESKNLAYPNPTANEVSIVIDNIGKIYKVELINELGISFIVPYNYLKNKLNIKNLGNFTNGYYIIKITGENKVVTNKIQIIK